MCTQSVTLPTEINGIEIGRIKTGEIFRDNFGSVWLTCIHCNYIEFTDIFDFAAHITIHFEPIKSEMIMDEPAMYIKVEELDPGAAVDVSHHVLDDDDEVHHQPPPSAPSFKKKKPSPLENSFRSKAAKEKPSSVANKIKDKQFRRKRRSTKTNPEKAMFCAYCQFSTVKKQKGLLLKHMWLKHGYGFECEQCDRKFSEDRNLKKHIKVVHDEAKSNVTRVSGDRICAYCNVAVGPLQSTMVDHMWTAHSYGFACPQCDRQFRNLYNMFDHLRAHSGVRPYECTECGRRYSSAMILKIHMRIHTNERPCLCPECGKSFYNSSSLASHHKRYHSSAGELKEVLCLICARSYDSQIKMEAHMNRVHSTHRPRLVCDICATVCKTRTTLVEHMRLHSGRKSLKCRYCDATFAQCAGRRCHERRYHEQTLIK